MRGILEAAAAVLVLVMGGCLDDGLPEPTTAPKDWYSLPNMMIFQHDESAEGEDIMRMGVMTRSDAPSPPPKALFMPIHCLVFDQDLQRVDSGQCRLDDQDYSEELPGYTIRYHWSAYVPRGAPNDSPPTWAIVVVYQDGWAPQAAWGSRVSA